ncbi:ABC transporter arginine-binding protein 1 precursor [Fluoribacter dumoffii]|uniref:ABC transporter arginine-binding protein 1 n=2 Tax=Fluoribacter dumoffii TaxID=463 RepID=A0A377GEB1_9GAMM|nr:arginine-binding periplasmic protein [Fluoribacter dumoffii NY 23]STO23104.1 ABC transporter arginine-binding protein 1 precursor [Fluoribacter dumoffii]
MDFGMNFRKRVTHLLLILFLFTGNASADNKQSIMVGVSKFAPPFSAADTSNHYFGFCIDIMNEICKRLNETCEYKAVTLQDQMDNLNSGNIDITFPPYPIPNIGAQGYIYSLPYMTSNGQFLTTSSNIKTLADIKNKRIGTVRETHLKSMLLLYTSADNIKEYPKVSSMIMALLNDDVDAIIMNINIFKYLTINKVIDFKTVGNPVILGNGYGIMALPKNTDLINKINKVLLQIENDGTYETIYNKYFGSNL